MTFLLGLGIFFIQRSATSLLVMKLRKNDLKYAGIVQIMLIGVADVLLALQQQIVYVQAFVMQEIRNLQQY